MFEHLARGIGTLLYHAGTAFYVTVCLGWILFIDFVNWIIEVFD